jgi:hypothetical protein
LAAAFVVPGLAHADGTKSGPAECWEAAEHAQELRDASKLTAASEATRVCLRESCHPEVRRDCVALAREISSLVPSVVVRAKDSRDSDVIGVRVIVDGVTVAGTLDGKALPIDPGSHVFRFEAAGGAALEQQVLVAVKEKDRLLSIRFAERLRVDGTIEPARRGEPPPEPTFSTLPPVAVVLTGVGVVALGSFIGFEVAGQTDYRNVRDTCGTSHSCTDDDVRSGRTKFAIAGVSLTVAVLALGGALFVALTSGPPVRSPPQTAGVRTPAGR